MRVAIIAVFLFALGAKPSAATTYYVDYASGSDAASGTSTSTPWKHAPGMPGCANTCAGVTPAAGDRFIFKGGVSWTGTDSFNWTTTANGTAGNVIYYGVDPTYYDTAKCQQVLAVTITNAGSGYSAASPPTPVFTAGAGTGAAGYALLNASGGVDSVVMTARGTGYSGTFTVTFSSGTAQGTATVNSGWCRPILDGNHTFYGATSGFSSLIYSRGNYVTYDNFELTNMSETPASVGNAFVQLIAGSGVNFSTNNTFENLYIHHWDSHYCFGTGNVAGGSSTITNFVPTSGQCDSTALGWLSANAVPYTIPIQVFPQGSYWPVQNGAPVISAISGTNPYTITTNSSTVAGTCTACEILFGATAAGAPMSAFYGNQGGNTGSIVTNSVIDGRDNAVVQMNPYTDCGLAVGLNTPCVAPSFVAAWRGPQDWVGNTIQFIDNGAVGSCGNVSSNTLQYIRLGTNPTGHTNIWESVSGDYAPTGCLFFNNVVRFTTNPNPNTPAGSANNGRSVGLSIQPSPTAGQTAYVFNNVIHDMITNVAIEPAHTGGNMVQFNNTMDCGTSWGGYTDACTDNPTPGATTASNNLYVTSASSAYVGTITNNNELKWTAAQATVNGYAPSTSYIYAPQTTNCNGNAPCAVGGGGSIASYCSSLTALLTSAGAACGNDTTYGSSYDVVHNTSTAGGRTALARSLSAPDVGAYQYAAAPASIPNRIRAIRVREANNTK